MIKEFQRLKDEESNSKRIEWDFQRTLSKINYRIHTDAINLRSQIGTSRWGGVRYVPMAFTEQGVAMLSSVLNSARAIKVNIQIIRLFTRMRAMLLNWNIYNRVFHENEKLLN